MKTCTKRWDNFPFAHRAPNHDGHCKLIHGHNWSFEVTFECETCDDNGFVFDFGKLQPVKKTLDDTFDHTLVLSANDPLRREITEFFAKYEIPNVRVIDDCSCEGIAKWVYHLVNSYVSDVSMNRVHVSKVTVYEDTRNSASYTG